MVLVGKSQHRTRAAREREGISRFNSCSAANRSAPLMIRKWLWWENRSTEHELRERERASLDSIRVRQRTARHRTRSGATRGFCRLNSCSVADAAAPNTIWRDERVLSAQLVFGSGRFGTAHDSTQWFWWENRSTEHELRARERASLDSIRVRQRTARHRS